MKPITDLNSKINKCGSLGGNDIFVRDDSSRYIVFPGKGIGASKYGNMFLCPADNGCCIAHVLEYAGSR